MELRAAEILREELPGIALSLSHEIGRVGFLERENAAIMNACLADLSKKVVDSFRTALAEMGITAPFYVSQNDGTLMTPEYVERYPVLTFASGPTNSMRGAALPLRHRRRDGRRHRRHHLRRRHADAGLPARERGRRRHRRGAHQLPHARRAVDRPRRRLARPRRRRPGRSRLGRLRDHPQGAGLRRRHADDDRHRRRCRARGHRRPFPRRPPSGCDHRGRARHHAPQGRRGGRPDEDLRPIRCR